jgi:hypothetical protein
MQGRKCKKVKKLRNFLRTYTHISDTADTVRHATCKGIRSNCRPPHLCPAQFPTAPSHRTQSTSPRLQVQHSAFRPRAQNSPTPQHVTHKNATSASAAASSYLSPHIPHTAQAPPFTIHRHTHTQTHTHAHTHTHTHAHTHTHTRTQSVRMRICHC